MVKLIHTADLHLDSAFRSRFTKEEAENRRQKQLMAWKELLSFAVEKKVQGILIAGDLFDSPVVSHGTMDFFLSTIAEHPEISFFYLRGNHDTENTFRYQENLPKNLFLFSDKGKKYRLNDRLLLAGVEYGTKDISFGENEGATQGAGQAAEQGVGQETVHGAEALSKNETESEEESKFLKLKEEDCNILLLHGALYQGTPKGDSFQGEEGIFLKNLEKLPLSYIALGHIHKGGEGKLNNGALWAYPGCLQGRGFDEEGERGFLYLKVEEEKKEIHKEFIPIKQGEFRILEIELLEDEGTLACLKKIEDEMEKAGISKEDSLRIILKGKKGLEQERNLRYLQLQLQDSVFFLEIQDESELSWNREEAMKEKSLKGEFLRVLAAADNLSKEEQEEIIALGMGLLQGGEL
ncbi:metallophosphoesterase family protein [Oribacterium sinus]|uniref:metallophosphoesterase family protein n=1 Tax=Oribacterium sinus TaxID=237576 RepID=UPI0028E4B2B8|nr:DNA repair exonuclease [Oribacterium sinus]